MEAFKSLYQTYSLTKFWVITTLISTFSVMFFPEVTRNLLGSSAPDETLKFTFILLILSAGVCLLPWAIWQHVQRKKFFNWLSENWTLLNEGTTHPEGYEINLDTKLIKYIAVFSVFLATVTFESRPYAYEHRSAGTAQFLFTVFSGLFGWWYFGHEGLVSTSKAIRNNLGQKNVFTLRGIDSET